LFISQPPGKESGARVAMGARAAVSRSATKTAVILIPDYAGGVAKRKSALVVWLQWVSPQLILFMGNMVKMRKLEKHQKQLCSLAMML
jgi:hypothetical protein